MEKKEVIEKIIESPSICLTTHKVCDADGLGSMLAFYFSLKKMGKKVQALAVDEIPQKYSFMNHQDVKVYQKGCVHSSDLSLIFDTNDPRLVNPLYPELKKKSKNIIFIDHHKPLSNSEDLNLFIHEEAASTGELCYDLLESAGASIPPEAAKALYISIIFDTHMFRSLKNLSGAFYTCSKLCSQVDINEVYENLFCRLSPKVFEEMLGILGKVQYVFEEKVALIECSYQDLQKKSLNVFHVLDCLDWVMKQKSVLLGIAIVEQKPQQFKLSLRSKKRLDISDFAESLGGGGHKHSAGASLNSYSRKDFLKSVQKLVS